MATSISSTKLWLLCLSKTNIWGLLGPILGRKVSWNQSFAIPCLVHPNSDILHLARDVLHFGIICGGMALPAAFIAQMIVIVSLFPLVAEVRHFTPFLPKFYSVCA